MNIEPTGICSYFKEVWSSRLNLFHRPQDHPPSSHLKCWWVPGLDRRTGSRLEESGPTSTASSKRKQVSLKHTSAQQAQQRAALAKGQRDSPAIGQEPKPAREPLAVGRHIEEDPQLFSNY